MTLEAPLVIIIGIVLIAVGAMVVYITWKRRKTGVPAEPLVMNWRFFSIQFAVGLFLALAGAFLMWNGSILGEDTTGIARVVGIVGIALIATAAVTGRAIKP